MLPTPQAPPALVPMPHAPAVFGLSRAAIYRAAGDGKIVLRKMGRSTLVETASALAYIASLPTATIRQAA